MDPKAKIYVEVQKTLDGKSKYFKYIALNNAYGII